MHAVSQIAYKALPVILRDERLDPVLSNMSKAYVGPDFGSRKVGMGCLQGFNYA
jgi:hypothetical protein